MRAGRLDDGSRIDLVRFQTLIEKAPGTFAIVTPTTAIEIDQSTNTNMRILI
jgi:hypothetical protein